MTSPDELMTIGDFARASGLSPKALRLYDDLGLLRPASVDAHSGYRRYGAKQLGPARLVASLRLLGMPLARIQQVLDLSSPAAAQEVESFWTQVTADVATRSEMVTVLLHQLRNEGTTMTAPNGTLSVEVGTSHCQGRREHQQDALLLRNDLIAVADGFGEWPRAAEQALAAYAEGGLERAVAATLSGLPGSGTTLTAVTINGTVGRITHVGDARVWLVRDGEVRQLTRDHTVVAALVESGQLAAEEARSHAHRSLLNRAVAPGVVADEPSVELHAGDRLVLTTDGVHSWLDDLDALLVAPAAPQAVADTVAGAVVAAGEPDNHTIVVVDLGRPSPDGARLAPGRQ